MGSIASYDQDGHAIAEFDKSGFDARNHEFSRAMTDVQVAYIEAERRVSELESENAKLRELARGLHMAYVGALNECESLNEGLIWEYSGSIDADVAKSRAMFDTNRHRFDAALCELGIEVPE